MGDSPHIMPFFEGREWVDGLSHQRLMVWGCAVQLGVVRGGDSWLIVEAMESGWGDESHGVSMTMVTIIRRPRAQAT